MSQDWYYAIGQQSHGPISLDGIRQALRSQPDPDSVLVWNAGMSEWAESRDVPELSQTPPPRPQQFAPQPQFAVVNPQPVQRAVEPVVVAPIAAPAAAQDNSRKKLFGAKAAKQPKAAKANDGAQPSFWARCKQNILPATAAVVGGGLSKALGPAFLIWFLVSGAAAGLLYFLLGKTPLQQRFRLLLSILGGHVVLTCLSYAALASRNFLNVTTALLLADSFVLLIVGILAVLLKSKPMLLVLVVLEVLMAGWNGYTLFNDPSQVLVAVFLSLRFGALVAAVIALLKSDNEPIGMVQPA